MLHHVQQQKHSSTLQLALFILRYTMKKRFLFKTVIPKFFLLFLFSMGSVYATSGELYKKLRKNQATVTFVGNNTITINSLTYKFIDQYARVYTTDGSGDYFNITSVARSEAGYKLVLENRNNNKSNGLGLGTPINLKHVFNQGNKIHLSVINENGFKSRRSGIANNLSYFVAKRAPGELDFARGNLWSYRYLINDSAEKAYSIKEIKKDRNWLTPELGATTIIINGVRDNGLSSTFGLAGSYYSVNRIEKDYQYENTATIISKGVAGDNTYLVVSNLKYDYQAGYDVVSSSDSSSKYNMLSIQKDRFRRDYRNENDEWVTDEFHNPGTHLIYLPGTSNMPWSLGDHIHLGMDHPNSAVVKSVALRGELTYLATSTLSGTVEPGEYTLLSVKKNKHFVVEAIADNGIYLRGIVNNQFAVNDVIKLVPRFSNTLSSQNGVIHLNGQAITGNTLQIDNNYRLTSSVTIPSSMTVTFGTGGRIFVGNAHKLIINGELTAPKRQIFYGAGQLYGQPQGKISDSNTSTPHFSVIPQWWGVKGDGVTNNTVPFNRLARTVQNHWSVFIPAGDYILDSGGVTLKGLDQVKVFGENDGEKISRLRPSKQYKHFEPGTVNELACEDKLETDNLCYGTKLPFGYYTDEPTDKYRPVPYFSTFNIDSSENITLQNLVIESRGRAWGDTDRAPYNYNAFGMQRSNWIIQGGGSAIAITRAKHIRFDNVDARLAGSVGVIYFSSVDDATVENTFANAGSLGYAGFAADNWADVYINRNGRYTFKNCSAYSEAGMGNHIYSTSGKGAIVVEGDGDNVLDVVIDGGVFANARPGGDFPEGGNGIASDSAHLLVKNAVLKNNLNGLRLHAKTSIEPLNIEVVNTQIINNTVSAIYSEFKNTGNSMRFHGNTLSVTPGSAWNFGRFSQMASMYPVLKSAILINARPFNGDITFEENTVLPVVNSKGVELALPQLPLLPLGGMSSMHFTEGKTATGLTDELHAELENWFSNHGLIKELGLANDMTFLRIDLALPLLNDRYIFNGQFFEVQHVIKEDNTDDCENCYRLFLTGDVRSQFSTTSQRIVGMYPTAAFHKVNAQVSAVGLANDKTFVDIVSASSPALYRKVYSNGVHTIAGSMPISNCENCYRLFFDNDIRASFNALPPEVNFIGLYER